MAFHTEKDLKSQKDRGKKCYILAKDVNTEINFEIKVNFGLKMPIYWCIQIQAGKVKLLGLFYKFL